MAGGAESTWRDVAAPVAVASLCYAGIFKGSSLFAWMPADLTLLAAVAVAVGVLTTAFGSRIRVVVPVGGLVLVAVCVPGLVVGAETPFTAYTQRALGLLLLTMIGAYWLIRTEARLRVWIWVTVLIGPAQVLVARQAYVGVGRFGITEGGSISTGQVAGATLVALVTLVVFGVIRGRPQRLVAAVVCAGMVWALVEAGSRGPILATGVALCVVAFLVPHVGRVKRVVALAAVVGAGWFALGHASGDGAARLQEALNDPTFDQLGGRSWLWSIAVEQIPAHPWGVGWGNFTTLVPTGYIGEYDARFYAHNLFLEPFIEGGWIAGAAVTVFVLTALVRLWRRSAEPFGAALVALAVFYATCSFVAGSITTNRPLFALLALGFVGGVRARGRRVVVGDDALAAQPI